MCPVRPSPPSSRTRGHAGHGGGDISAPALLRHKTSLITGTVIVKNYVLRNTAVIIVSGEPIEVPSCGAEKICVPVSALCNTTKPLLHYCLPPVVSVVSSQRPRSHLTLPLHYNNPASTATTAVTTTPTAVLLWLST